MLSKAKAFSKVFQLSKITVASLQQQSKFLFASSSPSSYDVDLGSKVDSKSANFVQSGQNRVSKIVD